MGCQTEDFIIRNVIFAQMSDKTPNTKSTACYIGKKLPLKSLIICREYVYLDGRENELSKGVLAANMQQQYWGILHEGDPFNPDDISAMREIVLIADLEDWEGALPQG